MKTKESIKIPFGAKDSELKGWEYTIPDGMVARIEGNKVILEPKESEDERIRKFLIDYFEIIKSTLSDGVWKGFQIEEIISWLEKQGEQNLANSAKTCKVEPKFKVGDCIYDKRDSYNRNVIREVGEDYYINAFGQKMDMTYTNANFEFIEHLEDDHINNKSDAWSEKDEKMLNDAIGAVGAADYYTYDDKQEIENWLKHLKERYTWKPSDEQMEYLAKAITVLGNECYDKISAILYELRTDLKKLKG